MDSEELILRSRALLTEQEDGVHFSREKLFALIPAAIASHQAELKVAGDLDGLKMYSDEVSVGITAGVADLTGSELDLSLIKDADFIVQYPNNPPVKRLQWVNSLNRITTGNTQRDLYAIAYLNGQKIHLSANASGTLVITGVTIAQNVEKLPDRLMGVLSKHLASLASAEIPIRSEKRSIRERKA